MGGRDKRLQFLFAFGLAIATLATRWPIHARTFFEFDSINFAVGTLRFDLAQVTPQMPGYILHILFGRALYNMLGNVHQAYLWISILLSIGSVLLLWRAAATLRGERVGVIAALLWLTLPLFWFHGAVDAIYAEEAFWTSALLYLGLKIITDHNNVHATKTNRADSTIHFALFAVCFSLAGAARTSDLLFFLPALLYLVWKAKLSPKTLVLAAICFIVVTALWSAELLREAGGIPTYLALAATEGNFKTQSILFGNSWRSQIDLFGKTLFYLAVTLGPAWILLIGVVATSRKHLFTFVQKYSRTTSARFIFLIAVAPLAFYLIVFFMKAGYLLNVLPSVILALAVLLDQSAIWIAEKQKHGSESRLTRPLITRNVVWLTGGIVFLNILWFFAPWAGTQQKLYDNENTRNSFVHGAMHRYEHSESRALTLANRAFEYTNVSGIRAVDNLNATTFRALHDNDANDSGEVVLASWWYRWGYLLLPHATLYDLELNPHHSGPLDKPGDSLWVGRSHEMYRVFLDRPGDSVIRFHSTHPVLLLLRHDRPDFDTIARQVHLSRLPLPEYLDVYKILDSTFTLTWHHRTFIEQ